MKIKRVLMYLLFLLLFYCYIPAVNMIKSKEPIGYICLAVTLGFHLVIIIMKGGPFDKDNQ